MTSPTAQRGPEEMDSFSSKTFDTGATERRLAADFGLTDKSEEIAVEAELAALADLTTREAKLALFKDYVEKHTKFKKFIEGLERKFDELRKIGVNPSDAANRRNLRILPEELTTAEIVLTGVMDEGTLYITDNDPLDGIDKEELEALIRLTKEKLDGNEFKRREVEIKTEKLAAANELKEAAAGFLKKNSGLSMEEAARRIQGTTTASAKKDADAFIRNLQLGDTMSAMVAKSRTDAEKTVFDDLMQLVKKYHTTLENFDRSPDGETKVIDINTSLQTVTGQGTAYLSPAMNTILSYLLERDIEKSAANAQSQGITIDRAANKTTDLYSEKKYLEGILRETRNIIALIDSRLHVAGLKKIAEVYGIQAEFFPESTDLNPPKVKAIDGKLTQTKTDIETAKGALARATKSAKRFNLKVGRLRVSLRQAFAILLALGLGAAGGRFATPPGVSPEEAQSAVKAANTKGKAAGRQAALTDLANELNLEVEGSPTVEALAAAIQTSMDAAAGDAGSDSPEAVAGALFVAIIDLAVENNAYSNESAALKVAGLNDTTRNYDSNPLDISEITVAEEKLLLDLIRRATTPATADSPASTVLKALRELDTDDKRRVETILGQANQNAAAEIITNQ